MHFVYGALLCLSLFFLLPQILWRRFIHGQFKGRAACFLSLSLPKVKPKTGKVFVFYAVSMGETKIAGAIFQKMKELYPEALFYIVSRSETGHQEAKRSISEADGHFFLPLDFSWTMRRFLKRLSPDAVIIIESDFWLNFLRISKKLGAQVFLVNGKVSKRSFERFEQFSFFAKKLFSFFDLMCLQNELFQQRFNQLGVDLSKTIVTGNCKFDLPFTLVNSNPLKKQLGIEVGDKVLVLGSTHPKEEEALLKALKPLWNTNPSLRVIIVPRHPERFSEVKEVLLKSSLSFISYSNIQEKVGNEKVVLVDAMGLLFSLYQIADVAIVGGSFFNSLKGHNIFEPIQAGVPVLFGPYMKDQKDLVETVLSSKSGVQTSLDEVLSQVEALFQSPEEVKENGRKLLFSVKGASSRTSQAIYEKTFSFFKRNGCG